MLRSYRLLLVLAALLGFAAGGFGQQPAFRDSLLDRLAGHWIMKGTIAGKETTHTVDAEWVMGHQYLQIHEVSKERNAEGEPEYEATVFVGWNPSLSQYACVWLDTYGGVSAIRIGNAKGSGNQIPFIFRDEKNVFHTVFIYHSKSDSWDWNLDSEATGKLSPFARLSLTRVK